MEEEKHRLQIDLDKSVAAEIKQIAKAVGATTKPYIESLVIKHVEENKKSKKDKK